ncbi:MAG: transcriptional regulator [Sphingobacteriales bacterium SCN 48-20]|jgi:DNA-binding HxlR family transcriptional regulator|uniref:winged helix-turn-helix transcriptional regulator n=1 Tax=Terrimonas ferruginea TaxID=249 RepID=UPI00086915FA|nr:helix-turn-helix domain-containing protein [Terrimonas ferruginea]MBN8783266.1 helix-turn-helix transcriptional regulator [Terrimonas ferruginea]ODT93304.1 MAG: transcriptional regulator [Sphingobacteriales bacterium SCN 48-20]OJW39881.1 MAG: transcriptional regulator [Sphingobacteriales bacterium 48-107]
MKTECVGDYVKLRGKTYPCTVSLTMDLVGGKWKAVILYHLMDQPKRYNELRKEMPAITEMTLSLQLKQLEKDGLVQRKVYGKKPPVKVVYSLTGLGKTLVPLLEAITQWGNQVVSDSGEFIKAS